MARLWRPWGVSKSRRRKAPKPELVEVEPAIEPIPPVDPVAKLWEVLTTDSAIEALSTWDDTPWLARELRVRSREPWRGDLTPTLKSAYLTLIDRDDLDTPSGRRLERAVRSALAPLLS